jgi:hypothetical protein
VTLEFTFRARIWLHEGNSPWHFVTLPKAVSEQIRNLTRGRKNAFGSLRVAATMGETRWKTSIFPDSKSARYVLPIKASVRRREQLHAGLMVEVFLITEP